MWELDHKEGWVPKNWCFWIVVLEKTLESPLDSKGIKPTNPKGNQPWIFIRRTDTEAEAPILWPPDGKSRLIGKDLDPGKDLEQEKGLTEDEMVGWHHCSKDMSLRKLRETVGREAWHATIQGVAKTHNSATEQQQLGAMYCARAKGTGVSALRSLQFMSKDVDLVVSSKEYNWIHKGWQTGFWRLQFKTEEQRATKNSILDGGDAEAANGSRTTFTWLFCYLPSSTVTRRRREKGLLFVLIRPLVEWRIQFSVPLLWKTNLQIKDHPGKPLGYRRDQYKQRLKELGRFILENKRLSENLISVFKSLAKREQTCMVEFSRGYCHWN